MSEPLVPFKVKAVYEYKSEFEDDLNFAEGDVITVTNIEDAEWYSGTLGGKDGLFPKNFVEIVPQAQVPKRPVKHVTEEAREEEGPAKGPEAGATAGPQADKSEPTADKSEPTGTSHTEPKPESKPEPKKTAAYIPTPVLPGQKRDDPYAVKKQFVAAAKSLYVPPVKPREDYTAHGRNDVAHNDLEIVKLTPTTHEEEEEAAPKMSLKERIAMLQQKQQEEAERAAAAEKRAEEKKKKAAEEKRQRQMAAEAAKDDVAPDEHEEEYLEEASEFTHQGTGASHGLISRQGTGASLGRQTLRASIVSDHDDVASVGSPVVPGAPLPSAIPHVGAPLEDTAEQDEPEPEDEDDEDLKRRRLVERMAKISGGRNMFGMMGMPTPFGGPAPKKEKSVGVPASAPEAPATLTPVAQAPPAPSVPAVPAAAPAVPVAGGHESGVNADDEAEGQPQSELLPKNSGFTSPVGSPKRQPSLKGLGDELLLRSIHILEATQRLEPPEPGYEADEDLSDRLKVKEALASPTLPRHPPPPPPQDIPKPCEPGYMEPPSSPSHGELPQTPGIDTDTLELEFFAPRKSPAQLAAGHAGHADHKMPPPPPPSDRVPPSVPPSSVPPSSVPPVPSSDRGMPPVPGHAAPGQVPQSPRAPLVPGQTPQSPQAPPVPGQAPQAPRVPPPVPEAKVPPPPPGRPDEPEDFSDSLDESDDEAMLTHGAPLGPLVAARLATAPLLDHKPPPPPPGVAPPVPVPAPSQGLARSRTDLLGFIGRGSLDDAPAPPSAPVPHAATTAGDFQSRASVDSIHRLKLVRSKDQLLAEAAKEELEYETNNVSGTSRWWLQGQLPEFLLSRAGVDLVYEVDTNQVQKRGGRSVNYCDYYIVFADLSQLQFEVDYDLRDPTLLVKCLPVVVRAPPVIRKDLLDRFHRAYGEAIVGAAAKLVGHSYADELVPGLLSQLAANGSCANMFPPIGDRAFGVTIYKNFNNANIAKIDEIRAGDILWIKHGVFAEKKLIGKKRKLVGGDDDHIHTAIIYDYDPKKQKIKVVGQDGHQVVKESYKIGDFQLGRMRVFRPVDRDYIGW